MTFDKTLPAGNTKISIGDDSIRDNFDAIETSIDLEHSFTTGGNQSGRHSFEIDTEANRDSPSVSFRDGGIFIATDVRSGTLVLQLLNASVWENADVDPKSALGASTLPRLNAQSLFIACQTAPFVAVVPAAGSPDTLAIDLSASPAKFATITGDTEISNPINAISGSSTTVHLNLLMSGAGHVITFGNNYRTRSGVPATVDSASGSKTTVYLTQEQDGTFTVSSIPGRAVIT